MTTWKYFATDQGLAAAGINSLLPAHAGTAGDPPAQFYRATGTHAAPGFFAATGHLATVLFQLPEHCSTSTVVQQVSGE